MIRYTILFLSLFIWSDLFALKKWVGNSPGGWENMLNWLPAGVPASIDDVLLDNTFQADNYVITIPVTIVDVHSLAILPSSGRIIELLLPTTNKNSPAINIGDAIIIGKGGVFRNSSGLTSGQSMQVSGSITIYDEGRYIHNTRSSHANDVVAKLSTSTGTARGVFEFDVPGGSYPISLSNRTFGTLELSSAASGGTQTYNASGANPVTVNGDLLINNGVQFNADLTKDMIIKGDYKQQGGIFNLASQSNSNAVKVMGNISQAANAVITETSEGIPVFELSGNIQQQVLMNGSITNNVVFSINNVIGAALSAPLSISYKLILAKGILKTSTSSLLTILDNGSVSMASGNSYIEGPVRKIGNSNFEFPIGKQKDYAPVKIACELGAGTNEFIAEYFIANPQLVFGSNFDNPPMVRVSALEYWLLKRLAGSSPCRLTLSVGTYSHATALDKLVVARWDVVDSRWKSEGNDAYAGIATGTIMSDVLDGFGNFTLASTVVVQNPLPLASILFNAIRDKEFIDINWSLYGDLAGSQFEIERSYDGRDYDGLKALSGCADVKNSSCIIKESGAVYLRLKVIPGSGNYFYSDVVLVSAFRPGSESVRIFPVPAKNYATVSLMSSENEVVMITISDVFGRRAKLLRYDLKIGKNEIDLPLSDLKAGVYTVQVFYEKGGVVSKRFVKL